MNKTKNRKKEKNRRKKQRILALLLAFGITAAAPAVDGRAAVITSNATDKTAVVFNENTDYSEGDYVTYGGEMYLCTEDIKGSWNTAKEHFMQITKNHELGNSEDLSAVYNDAADPADEKSLMAFVANAWQKLKGFLGTGNKAAKTDKGNYKNASVSAKLNFLEEQNETLNTDVTKMNDDLSTGVTRMHESLSTDMTRMYDSLGADVARLQEEVSRSFRSVSNGKSLLANTIAGKGVTVRQDAKFAEINTAILDMAQLQYNKGNTAGYNTGKTAGIQEADNRLNTNSKSYQQGLAQGNTNGYNNGYSAGVTAGKQKADSEVNKNSASYKQGLRDANIKSFSVEAELDINGVTIKKSSVPDADKYFSFIVNENNHIVRKFSYSMPGSTIIGIRAYEYTHTRYSSGYMTQMALRLGNEYLIKTDGSSGGTNAEKIQVTSSSLNWGTWLYDRPDNTPNYTILMIDILYI